MNKIVGIVLIVLALVIGILPQFTDCQSQGKSITLASGKSIPMKCHWTAIAEITMAIPLAGLGGMLFFSKRKETRLVISATGAILGVLVVLVPVTLIGVCSMNTMLCNNLMKPALILSGILVVAASLVSLVGSYRMVEPTV
jgi:hypothetical protein